jgi:hypothetical protein
MRTGGVSWMWFSTLRGGERKSGRHGKRDNDGSRMVVEQLCSKRRGAVWLDPPLRGRWKWEREAVLGANTAMRVQTLKGLSAPSMCLQDHRDPTRRGVTALCASSVHDALLFPGRNSRSRLPPYERACVNQHATRGMSWGVLLRPMLWQLMSEDIMIRFRARMELMANDP